MISRNRFVFDGKRGASKLYRRRIIFKNPSEQNIKYTVK